MYKRFPFKRLTSSKESLWQGHRNKSCLLQGLHWMCSRLWTTLFSFWAFCKVKVSFILKYLILPFSARQMSTKMEGRVPVAWDGVRFMGAVSLYRQIPLISMQMDEYLKCFGLFLFNSLGFRQGQGQSNSHQLFWFFSGMLGQVVAAFILIREINERERVQGILGKDCCCYYKRRVKASWQRRGGVDVAWKRCREHDKFWMRRTALTRLCTQVKLRTSAERRTLERHARIDSQKGNIWECEIARTLREGNYSRMRDVQFAPQPGKQHNRVIKSDVFARNFGNGICPSLRVHPHSLAMRQSLHPSQSRCRTWNQLSPSSAPPPELLTLFCFLAFAMNMNFMM